MPVSDLSKTNHGNSAKMLGDSRLADVGKITRFGAVGLFNSALYSGFCILFIDLMHVDPTASSAIAFTCCLPLAFWNHKRVTFRSEAPAVRAFWRFSLLQAVGFGIAVILMYLIVQPLHLHYGFAILTTLAIVPGVSFIVMDRWIF